jgi:hypothetical protein
MIVSSIPVLPLSYALHGLPQAGVHLAACYLSWTNSRSWESEDISGTPPQGRLVTVRFPAPGGVVPNLDSP